MVDSEKHKKIISHLAPNLLINYRREMQATLSCNLVNCCALVRKIPFEKACNKRKTL